VLDRIKVCFTESIQTQIAAAEALPDAISRAAMTLVQSLLNGNKISVVVMGRPLPTHSILLPA
jgi:DnaA initiator-associating protein